MTDAKNSKPLKTAVKDKLENIELNQNQLQSLIELQEKSQNKKIEEPKDQNDGKTNRRRWMYSLTAVASVLFFLIILNPLDKGRVELSIGQKIANEVAYNHLKLKPLEVTSSLLPEVSSYFTELDFSPVESSIIKAAPWELLGARYCSIQGFAAAQIRYKNSKSGQLESFYEAEYKPEIHGSIPKVENGERPLKEFAKGIGVEIWVEKGLLMARTVHN